MLELIPLSHKNDHGVTSGLHIMKAVIASSFLNFTFEIHVEEIGFLVIFSCPMLIPFASDVPPKWTIGLELAPKSVSCMHF